MDFLFLVVAGPLLETQACLRCLKSLDELGRGHHSVHLAIDVKDRVTELEVLLELNGLIRG